MKQMFTDEIEIDFKAGHGGPGKVGFFPGIHSGPSGGDGGKGGDLYVYANARISNLNHFVGKKFISAEDGQMGEGNNMSGAGGKDLEIGLPLGSTLIDLDTGDEIEFLSEGQKVLLCVGGLGGRGNAKFKSAANTTPMYAQKGLEGQFRHFKIVLRMIADFGLIGLPNAGKSSLLNELTNADVKVANYPFTTLEPNLGVVNGLPAGRQVIADIPGLIEGAAEGKGLGVSFLKHIEKVKLLIHCISSESENVVSDYEIIVKELKQFNSELALRKQIILLTKSDLIDAKQLEKNIKILKKFKKEILPISILDSESINKLKDLLYS